MSKADTMKTLTNRFGSVQFQLHKPNLWGTKEHIPEHLDCTVRAYSKVTDVPYPFAHAVLESLGRQQYKGFSFHNVAEWDGQLQAITTSETVDGGSPYTKRRKYSTVARFIREHSKGRFVVRVDRHVFALVDGVVYDSFEPTIGARVYHAWEYKP